jgi:hypothetical protein
MGFCQQFCTTFESWAQSKVEGASEVEDIKFESALSKLDDSFMLHSRKLVDLLGFFAATDYEHHMNNLICRLDYNNYYTQLK